MKKIRGLFLAVLFSSALLNTSAKPVITDYKDLPSNITFWSNYNDEVLARGITERMTDAELLSQVLMFGWSGQMPGSLLQNWVSQGLGGVKVFGWNTDNLNSLARSVKQLQGLSQKCRFKIPLFVATDQEGGWIRHVKGNTSETPGNMAIGASGSLTDAYYSAFYINREIKSLGINMNFAPALDLYTDLQSTIIGPRSFGADPKSAGQLGEAFALGSSAAGVIPTAKHFPGHGDTDRDSHGFLPEINIDRETFENRELIPFKYLIKANIPAVMSGHLSFPQIDPSGAPASLSRIILTDILREELGYQGLIITDDIMMAGATSYAGSLTRTVTLALQAGNDIVMSSSTASPQDNLWTRNLELMKTSPDFKNTVKEHVYRVILAKLKYFKSDNAAPLYPDENKISEHIPDKEGQKFFLQQACRSITLYRGQLPLNEHNGEKILLAGCYSDFLNEGRKRFPDAQTYFFAPSLRDDMSNVNQFNAVNLESIAASYDTIIINVFDEHSARIAQRLSSLGKKVIIFSTLTPVPVLNFNWADVILLGYSNSSYTYQALFAALKGDYKPSGILPLEQ